MGMGYGYKCKKCGKEFYINLGIGMGFPTVYRETVEKIKNGKYGKEYKELMNSQPYVAVNAESELYKCKCGYWKVKQVLDLYAPNDPEQIANEEYGIHTVKEWGYIPYVMEDDIQENYHLIKSYNHKCPKCKSKMEKVTQESDFMLITCPKCGSMVEQNLEKSICWD